MNHKKITIVNFTAFDQKHEEHYFDKSADECINYIWKHLCNTAVIHKIVEYHINEDMTTEIKDFKNKQC